MLVSAPGALFLKIRENCQGKCLGSRAPSFQNDGLQGSSNPPLGASLGDLAMPNHEPHHPIENMEQPGLLQHTQEPPNDLHEPVQDQIASASQQQIILK